MSATGSHKVALSCGRKLSGARRIHAEACRPDNFAETSRSGVLLSRRDTVVQSLAVCIALACADTVAPEDAFAADGKDFVTLPSGLKVLDLRCRIPSRSTTQYCPAHLHDTPECTYPRRVCIKALIISIRILPIIGVHSGYLSDATAQTRCSCRDGTGATPSTGDTVRVNHTRLHSLDISFHVPALLW